MIVALVVFWVSFAVCAYVYFGYPALLWLLSRLRPRPVRAGGELPLVTFIIPAHNEEKVIAEKIENTLELDYPADRVDVLVVSNGSTDATNEIVRTWPDGRVRLLALEQPGKMEALNAGALAATGEVLVFSDADFLLDEHSLMELARKFGDPDVGGVCGARKPGMERKGDATGDGEGMYGRWDKWQKVRESEIGSVFAADGLLYAIRRSLYVPVADPAQADDIAISARVVLQGYRLLFEPHATAWERSTVHAEEEFRRKIRVTNHSVRALLNLGPKALFGSGFYSVELLSHKLVRHFVPVFLLTLLIASVPLALHSFFYALALGGQLALYALAVIGGLLRNSPAGHMPPLAVPYYFCLVNAAAFLGIVQILRGERLAAWSSRPNVAEPHRSVEERAMR